MHAIGIGPSRGARDRLVLLGLVAALVVAGCSGGAATASPSSRATPAGGASRPPSVGPSGRPSAAPRSATLHAHPAGPLEPGTYRLDVAGYGVRLPRPLEFTVPGGWEKYDGTLPAILHGAPEPPAGMGLTFWTVDNVLADPCDPGKGGATPSVGPGVDDLGAALAAVPGYRASTPVEAEVAGEPALYVELTAPEDASACTDQSLKLWTGGGREYGQGAGQRNVVWILDVEGVRLVIGGFHYPGTPEADVAELRAIVGSLAFADGS